MEKCVCVGGGGGGWYFYLTYETEFVLFLAVLENSVLPMRQLT